MSFIRTISEMWKFRALTKALVGRHLRTRYRGSVLGFIWSFLNPLCLIAVYALVFKYYIRFDSVENYTLFLFAGLLPWIWFSSALLEACVSISGGGSLITKAMFPPQVLPLVSVVTQLMNFLFAVPLLIAFMLYSGVVPNISLIALPLILFNQFIFLLGLSLLFSAINVKFRDVQHILGNVVTLWFFLCPILYPANVVPDKFKFTLILNPVAQYSEMYQSIFLNGQFPDWNSYVFTLLIACVTFLFGNIVFDYFREDFAEFV